MPYFSVIIPTYNRTDYLSEALESVARQTFKDYEILVIDDGSTDNTAEIVAARNQQIRYFFQLNKGPGAARNLGINYANGEYIAFLDSDDLWFRWTLEAYYEALNISKASWVAGKGVNFTKITEVEEVSKSFLKWQLYPDYLSTSNELPWIGTCATVISRKLIQSVGGFSELNINAEDSELWLKLGAAPIFSEIKSPPVFAYRKYAESAVSDMIKSYQGMMNMVLHEKNWEYPGGKLRKLDRLKIITTHIYFVSVFI